MPPGPIGSPGRDAIRAVLAPDGSDYLFFVWDPDSSAYLFARTLREHERNVQRVFGGP